VRLAISEIRSGAQSEVPPDLLVVAVDPAAVARGRSGDLAATYEAARRAMQARPATALVLAYTKADEYGVIDSHAVRLIGSTAHVESLQRFRAEADEKSWDEFATSTTRDRSSERHDGGAIFRRQAKGAATGAEWTPTRAWVIRQTRMLWDLGLQLRPTPLLNGYFLAADSRDPYLQANGRSGVSQLLADMFQLYKLGRPGAIGALESAVTPSRGRGSLGGRRELS
jgi:hypothetical protein